jgi:parvulin-like peptidyl-prolyl isomerase
MALAGLLWCGACQSNHTGNVPTLRQAQSPAPGPAESTAGSGPSDSTAERPVAMLENEAVTIRSMQDRLFERSGAEILRELQLETALRRALSEQDMTIDEQDLDHEEQLLLSRLSADENAARELLSQVRGNEGLGPVRYEALLWRNAALRALVQDDLQLNEPLLRRLHRMQHGPRLRTRLLVVPTLQEAEELHARLAAGEAFDALAATRSIDSSRDRGGLVEPISLEDPAWPAALRAALESTPPGGMTDIVFLEDRFAIARVENEIPADGIEFETARDEMMTLARLTQERLKMADLAGRLGITPSLQVLDPTLRQAWKIDETRRQGTP